MDQEFESLTNSGNLNGSGFDDGFFLASLEQSNLDFQIDGLWDSVNGFEHSGQHTDCSSFAPLNNVSSEVDFLDDHESYPVLKYINEILMEEFMEEPPNSEHDPQALQAAEKSLDEIIGKTYTSSPCEQPSAALDNIAESPDGINIESSSQLGNNNSGTDGTSVGPQSMLHANKLSGNEQELLDKYLKLSFQTNSLQSLHPLIDSGNSGDSQVGSLTDKNQISSFFSDSETILQFKKGLEEGHKFLPTGNQLIIDINKSTLPFKPQNVEVGPRGMVVRGKKHQHQNDSDEDLGSTKKQSALYSEEVELTEAFDKILLYTDPKVQISRRDVIVELPSGLSKTLHENELLHGPDVGMSTRKRQNIDNEALDLSAILISCAQSVVAGDHRTANEQLKLIRQHASCSGNPQQRLAVLFANALEARLAGTGPDLYASPTSKRISAAEELKAFRVYLRAPFRQMASFFANKMILEASSKAATLHIVDFGIDYGFHWPSLIQQLSNRADGPPKLRITGIDLPQPGFRPAEKVEQTGPRLARYCERFNVPFEYKAIAIKSWERIRIEHLKLTRNEVLAVSSQLGFKYIVDGTIEDDCPRDVVLSLIREMNPDIFVNDVLSGQLSSPIFLNRFRETFLFFSTIFDLIDKNLPRNDTQRLKFENKYLGTDVMNIIACEGSARVQRPETYKQWQNRYRRAGFRPLPLNQNLMKELRKKVKEDYHKDFMLDEDANWMLQGWKGKIVTACSCWVPA